MLALCRMRLLRLLAVYLAACAVHRAISQDVPDSPGITVLLNGAALLHRTAVLYPPAAREKGIQGAVTVDVTLDEHGNVSDARVVNGPQELRRASLESVLAWHFTRDAANTTRQITIQFLTGQQNGRALVRDFDPTVVVLQASPAGPLGRPIRSIQVDGIAPEARDDLLAGLPAKVGDTLTLELAEAVGRAVKDFDEHLRMGFTGAGDEVTISILLPGSARRETSPVASNGPERIQVTAQVQQMKLTSAPPPQYPPLAKQARIQGVVKLSVVIGQDGTVQNTSLVSGHPLLVPAALEAVKRWTYQPTALNGKPTEVQTEVDVNFTLPPEPHP
jgi:TonB family protein